MQPWGAMRIFAQFVDALGETFDDILAGARKLWFRNLCEPCSPVAVHRGGHDRCIFKPKE